MAPIPFRYLISFLLLGSILAPYIGRLNLAIAIVYMAKPNPSSFSQKITFSNESDVCPDAQSTHLYSPIESPFVKDDQTTTTTFDWDETTQGHLLSAFFYGYIVTQIPVGIAVNRYGPRIVCSIGILGTGLLNLVTPLIVPYFWLFMGSRVAMGLLQSGVFSCLYGAVTRWIPESERSTVLAFGQLGSSIGSILTSSMTGYLCKVYGWPSVFYVSGAVITAYGLLYLLLMTNNPRDHCLISKEEVAFIEANIPQSTSLNKGEAGQTIPWRAIATCWPFWASIATKYPMILVQNTIIYKTSAYMSTILRMPIDEIGYYSSAFYAVNGLSYFIGGLTSDWMLRRQLFARKTTVRKIHQSIATFGTSAMFLLIPLANCDRAFFLVALMASKLTYGLSTGGENPIANDLSNAYGPLLFSIGNMICTTAGFAPQVMGPILDRDPSTVKHTWWYIFAFISGLNALGGLVFLIWGSAEPVNW